MDPFGSTSAFTSSGSSIYGGTSEVTGTASSTTGSTTAALSSSGSSSFSGLSSTIPNSGSGFLSSTFSTVTSTGNGIFGSTSATTGTGSRIFGDTSPGLVFGSTPSSNNNNDQMEDSMAEDTFQASPTIPTFSQLPISPPASGFVFGGQPSIAAPQNPSPFLASRSLEFGAGGIFSLGTGGGDKSGRKFVKVRKQRMV